MGYLKEISRRTAKIQDLEIEVRAMRAKINCIPSNQSTVALMAGATLQE